MALIGPSVPISARHHQIVIQMFTDAIGDSGFPIETFTDLATLCAAREPILTSTTAERFNADVVAARSFDCWTMPYLAAIDPDVLPVAKMRLVYEGQPYDIVDAHVINMRADITMTTLRRAA